MIADWRAAIGSIPHTSQPFIGTNAYSSMRPYLRRDVINTLEATTGYLLYPGGRGDNETLLTLLFDEAIRIERHWKLL